ncbi:MAG: rhodanese-like domain-containing protein [Ferruginibacter sp.]
MHLISNTELRERKEAGEKINLLDVRETHEHDAFNIGGIHLPLGHVLSLQTDTIDHLKNEEVICYCKSGQRSMQASLMLESQGFTNVKNLTGGVTEWQRIEDEKKNAK